MVMVRLLPILEGLIRTERCLLVVRLLCGWPSLCLFFLIFSRLYGISTQASFGVRTCKILLVIGVDLDVVLYHDMYH